MSIISSSTHLRDVAAVFGREFGGFADAIVLHRCFEPRFWYPMTTGKYLIYSLYIERLLSGCMVQQNALSSASAPSDDRTVNGTVKIFCAAR